MKISYNWLNNYFGGKLPAPEKVADALTFHVFEIESLDKVGNDILLDVKVLPDRARYALSHKGIAYELSAILNMPVQVYPVPALKSQIPGKKVNVRVEDAQACPRYMARRMEGVTMVPTPEWLRQSLESVGQRSINSIVDAANLTLLDLGQPLHVFDADKLQGDITLRYAKAGEKITTLDNKEINLDPSILLIADDAGPLVIAGIKGGTRAEVTSDTKNIIIESANFNPSLIRKTSTKIGIRTDASKRYENGVSPDLVADGMEKISSLIETMNNPQAVSEITDIYPVPVMPWKLKVDSEYIANRLGTSLDEKTISDILNRLLLKNIFNNSDKNFEITVPTFRGDLVIPQDIVEEVGRIYGYENIPATELPETSFKPAVIKGAYYSEKIRDVLVNLGFSEVYTYAFGEKGEIELEKALAADKKFLRSSLQEGVTKALDFNAKNADLLGLDSIKIFEIGSVFRKDGEFKELAIGVKHVKKSKQKESVVLKESLAKISEMLGGADLSSEIAGIKDGDTVVVMNLQKIIETLPEPKEHGKPENSDSGSAKKIVKKYSPISVYPFSVRDIAVFTPENTQEKDVRDIIEKEAGSLMVRNTLFDVFTKPQADGAKKTSYAFRMVFQSFEKTLTEDEINSIMKKITDSLNGREGWAVR